MMFASPVSTTAVPQPPVPRVGAPQIPPPQVPPPAQQMALHRPHQQMGVHHQQQTHIHFAKQQPTIHLPPHNPAAAAQASSALAAAANSVLKCKLGDMNANKSASSANLEARKKEFSEQLATVLRENAILRHAYVNHYNQLQSYQHENSILRQRNNSLMKELHGYRQDRMRKGAAGGGSDKSQVPESEPVDVDKNLPPPATPFSVEVLLAGQATNDGSALRVPAGVTMVPRVDLTPSQYPPATTFDYYRVSHNQTMPETKGPGIVTTRLPEEPLMQRTYGPDDLQRYFADQRQYIHRGTTVTKVKKKATLVAGKHEMGLTASEEAEIERAMNAFYANSDDTNAGGMPRQRINTRLPRAERLEQARLQKEQMTTSEDRPNMKQRESTQFQGPDASEDELPVFNLAELDAKLDEDDEDAPSECDECDEAPFAPSWSTTPSAPSWSTTPSATGFGRRPPPSEHTSVGSGRSSRGNSPPPGSVKWAASSPSLSPADSGKRDQKTTVAYVPALCYFASAEAALEVASGRHHSSSYVAYQAYQAPKVSPPGCPKLDLATALPPRIKRDAMGPDARSISVAIETRSIETRSCHHRSQATVMRARQWKATAMRSTTYYME